MPGWVLGLCNLCWGVQDESPSALARPAFPRRPMQPSPTRWRCYFASAWVQPWGGCSVAAPSVALGVPRCGRSRLWARHVWLQG